MGFEPTRAEHIGLAVQRLNHSATSSPACQAENYAYFYRIKVKNLVILMDNNIF